MTATRRAFLGAAASLPLSARLALADDAPRLVPRSREPLNLESPFASLDSFLTPSPLFYVRNHYPVPALDPKSFRLEVAGAVARKLSLSMDDLAKLKEVTLPLTLECAGNGRAFLQPKTKGLQWELGAVSTAEWTGVPLSAVLDLAGVERDAAEVVLDAADKGDPQKEIQPSRPVSYSRSLPLTKARRAEVMLAWKMNGRELTPEHGRPLRAVVGGWYGMASVKWLTRLIVTKTPYRGFDQTIDYATWVRNEHGLDELVPLGAGEVKASIARPLAGERVKAGEAYKVRGAAWAGENEVARVEVSLDGGKTWSAATLTGRAVPFCWRLWEYEWKPAAGAAVLMARATDRRGRTQPASHDPNRRNYAINFVRATPVTVDR